MGTRNALRSALPDYSLLLLRISPVRGEALRQKARWPLHGGIQIIHCLASLAAPLDSGKSMLDRKFIETSKCNVHDISIFASISVWKACRAVNPKKMNMPASCCTLAECEIVPSLLVDVVDDITRTTATRRRIRKIRRFLVKRMIGFVLSTRLRIISLSQKFSK